MLPDQTGLGKTFDYLVPPRWADRVRVGTRVRIALGPRRVGAWVVEVGVEPPAGVTLREVAKWSGHGPGAELVALADWARWRWAARTAVPFLRTASPARNVERIPDPPRSRRPPPPVDDALLGEALAGGAAVLRLPPTEDVFPVVLAASGLGDALVVCPSRHQVRHLAVRLRRAGVAVAVHPDDWAVAAAGGCTVIGTRAAAWSPVGALAAVVVIDEHDEVHQEERSPTWNARDVVIERARRAEVPAVLVSPMPTLEVLAQHRLVRVDRARERAGWPAVVPVDRRQEDTGRNALFSPALVDAVRSGARVMCVLNQKGRAALLACAACADLARCAACGGPVRAAGGDGGPDELACRRCGTTRPVICASCGGLQLKTVRMGVSRVVHDLAVLAGERVVEVTADTGTGELDSARLHVGTEAVLHRVGSADVVAFLDFDQELLAPRYRAAEEALSLVVRAGRVAGGRRGGGRVLLQTRMPDHEVCRAAVLGDPERVAEVESDRRRTFGFPPHRAIAEVGGPAAEAFVAGLPAGAGVEVLGPVRDTWRLRAADHRTLCDALERVERPAGRLRLAVDPLRL